MTSISTSLFSAQSAQRPPSPRDRLQTELQSAIAAGEISSTDESALSSALDSIDSTLRSERSSSGQRTAPPSPEEMQAKISGLIQDQVEAGTLTEEQAAALEDVFESAFAGGPGGAKGAGGPPPPPPSDESSSSGASGETDMLAELLKQLQEALKSKNDYGSSGTTTSSDAAAGLVLDMIA